MTDSTLNERLAALPNLGSVPAAQLDWLATHGVIRRFEDGETLYGRGRGEDLRGVFLVLSGRFAVCVDSEGMEREVRAVKPGEISGYLPYSRIVNPAAFLVAVGPTEVLSIAESEVREMASACYDFTALCVHAMVDRARDFKSDDLHKEKMAALGRLSAGLAHELNNPSSAMARTARELEASRTSLADAARALGGVRLTGDAQAASNALEAAAEREPASRLSALARSDREEEILEWLKRHGLEADAAPVLAGSGLALSDLDTAAAALDGEALGFVVRYVAARIRMRQLAREIANAATRVHSLVKAVKAHTQMDRAAAPEAVDLRPHLEDTIALLGSKAASRRIALELNVEPTLPPVRGMVGELNHVWLHLIDNAIDAAPDSGHVAVTARAQRGGVVVEVVDDGAGIDEPDLGRVFDPFFTTKEVGQGAGLGLNVVQTLVQGHGGSVSVTSRPGRTEFRVALPCSGASRADRR